MIRAVVTDLDGTIVNDDGSVSPRMLAAAAALRKRGIPLIAATARTPFGVGALRELAPLFTLAVCGGGSIGWVPATKEFLWQDTFDPEHSRRLIEACLRVPGAGVGAFDGERWLMTNEYATLRGWQSKGPRHVVEIAEIVRARASSLGTCAPRMTPFALMDALAADGIGPDIAHVTTAGRNVVDLTPSGVDKRYGVAKALELLGIAPQDAVAFGDMPADVPMFGLVGYAVAVGAAHPDVVAAAHHVTAGVDEDGVPVVLEALGL
jgi:Cof subfamily protein (haloacid dehalogenase superfamily)